MDGQMDWTDGLDRWREGWIKIDWTGQMDGCKAGWIMDAWMKTDRYHNNVDRQTGRQVGGLSGKPIAFMQKIDFLKEYSWLV